MHEKQSAGSAIVFLFAEYYGCFAYDKTDGIPKKR